MADAEDITDRAAQAAEEAGEKLDRAADEARDEAQDVADASDGVSGNTGDGPGIDASGPVADGFAGGATPEAGS